MPSTTLTAITLAAALAAPTSSVLGTTDTEVGPVVHAAAGEEVTSPSAPAGTSETRHEDEADPTVTTDAPAPDAPDATGAPGAPDPVTDQATTVPPTGQGDTSCSVPVAVPQAALTEGYHQDGVDRPFWWQDDGLHFRDPIPANGYVNINVPGAQNLSIDTNRDLIGATFIPWERFGLQPGMCVGWTQSNGYSYHFGEDNRGRGGVDERGWRYCVPSREPGVVDPDPETPGIIDPDPDPEPEPEPEPGTPEAPGVVEPPTSVDPAPAGQSGGADAVTTSAVLAADDTTAPRSLAVTGAGTTALGWAGGLVLAGVLARLLAVRHRRELR
jgi:hypothetical protein